MTETDADILKAEVVALQAVLIAFLRRAAADNPQLVPTLCDAFDEAESTLTGVTIKIGMDAPAETTIGALRVVEELRDAVIRDDAACRTGD